MTSLGQTAASVRSRGVAGGGVAQYDTNSYPPPPEQVDERDRRQPTTTLPNRASSLAYSGKLGKDGGKYFGASSAQYGISSGITRVEWRLLAIIIVIASVVRMYKIGQPSSVV